MDKLWLRLLIYVSPYLIVIVGAVLAYFLNGLGG